MFKSSKMTSLDIFDDTYDSDYTTVDAKANERDLGVLSVVIS